MEDLRVAGWVRTRRDSKEFSFLELNDGTCLGNLQIVADAGIAGFESISKMNTGASVEIRGKLIPSPAAGQDWEMQATSLKLLGEVPEDYPLQKKGHGQEFLRSIAHLRPRTNLYGATMRYSSTTRVDSLKTLPSRRAACVSAFTEESIQRTWVSWGS